MRSNPEVCQACAAQLAHYFVVSVIRLFFLYDSMIYSAAAGISEEGPFGLNVRKKRQ